MKPVSIDGAWEYNYIPSAQIEVGNHSMFNPPPSFEYSQRLCTELPTEPLHRIAMKVVSSAVDTYKMWHWRDKWCDDRYDSELSGLAEQVEKLFEKEMPSVPITVGILPAHDYCTTFGALNSDERNEPVDPDGASYPQTLPPGDDKTCRCEYCDNPHEGEASGSRKPRAG